ncbi:MAG: LppX_LprAFG lipoprotein [Nocardioides sp.]
MRHTTRTRRTVAAALAAPLLVSGLAACGSESGTNGGSDAAPVSEGLESGESVDKADFIADLKAGMESATTAQMEMEMNLGQSPIRAEGEMDYSGDAIAMDMTMESGMTQEPLELVLVDNVMYLNMGQMSNGKYIEYDLSDAKNLPPGMDQMAEQLDPLAAFDSMEAALTSVTFEGDEDVDGDRLSHFELTMDTSKIETMKEIPAQAGLPKEVTYDLWLDGENRMRQMNMVMEMATKAEIDAKIFDWGEPVEIEAPAKSEVVKAPPMDQMPG